MRELKTSELTLNTQNPEFIVVGDTHFSNRPPSCRIDDYSETCLNKLSFILDYCILNCVAVVIIEGDVFHKQQIPIQYLTNIISIINQKKKEYALKNNESLTIASIIGNHDLPFENFKFIDRSPLYLLFETGCIDYFNHINIKTSCEDIHISGFDYSKEIKPSSYKNECCVAHCFFGFDFINPNLDSNESLEDRITEDEAKELGYSVYFLGHDHTFYGITKRQCYTVVRPGSLLRNSSHTQQTNRIPCFYHVKKQNSLYEFKCVSVNIALEAKSIFTEESLIKTKKQELEENIKTNISDIILSLSEDDSKENSVINMLNEITKTHNVSRNVYNLLTKYLSRENVL